MYRNIVVQSPNTLSRRVLVVGLSVMKCESESRFPLFVGVCPGRPAGRGWAAVVLELSFMIWRAPLVIRLSVVSVR